MILPAKLKAFNIFVKGHGYAGKIEELTPPKRTEKTEEYRSGGMDIPIDISLGQEKIEMSMVLAEYDSKILKLWGKNQVPMRLKGSMERDDLSGDVIPVEFVLRGRFKEFDFGTWKAGDNNSLTASPTITYYKLIIDGEVIEEIDPANTVHMVGDEDILAKRRQALGL